MQLVRVDPQHPEPETIARAAELLRASRLVAFPTETVYGLGGAALDPRALQAIFAAKRRPSAHPLIAHAADAQSARALAAQWPESAQRLAERFWPGPLTLVVAKSAQVPDALTAGLPTVALRVPRHAVALALLRAFGGPVAAPSANRYSEVSPTTAQHVASGLGDRVDLILDAGPTEVGIESTVVDLSGAAPVLLRPGGLARAEIERVVGALKEASSPENESAPRPSPGMAERHYAPRAALHLVRRADLPQSENTGALVFAGSLPPGPRVLEMPTDPAAYARRLYAALRELDALGCERILVEEPPASAEWEAIRDRLRRASKSP